MPMPRRRAGLAIVVLSLSLSQLVSAVTLQDCATRCVTISATTTCNIDEFACLCKNSSTAVVSCINKICAGTTAFNAHKDFATQCRAVGVQVADPTPTSTTAPPQDTTTTTPPDQGNSGQQSTPSSQPASTPSSSSTTPPANPSGSSTRSTSDSSSTALSGQSSIPDTPSSPTDTNTSNGSSGQTTTPGETSSGGSSLGSLVGAIVGGLVGGLLVVGLAFFILRRRRRDVIDTDSMQAFRPGRTDDTSYFSGDSKRSPGSGGILLNDMSSDNHYRDVYSPVSHHSGMGLPPGAAVPFNRGPGSVSDSQSTTAAAHPAIFEVDAPLQPRKGDPPRIPSMRGPASVISESAYSQQTAAPNEGAIPDHISTILSTSGAAQGLTQNLTPQQLTAVSAMVNSGLPGTAVVDVIQAMLNENQDAPPGYPGTIIRGGSMMPPPPPGSVSGGSGSGSGSGSRSGEQSSSNLPYRRGGSSATSS